MFVIIVLRATKDPITYDPLSPKNIFALGKLNKRKDNKIIIWAIKNIKNSLFPLEIFIKNKIRLIIIKLIANRPLNPSIKFAPLIINKKHNKTKIEEKISIFKKLNKKGISTFKIFIGRKWIKKRRKIIINRSLLDGLMLILISSKKPIKNIKLLMKIYSNKIFEKRRKWIKKKKFKAIIPATPPHLETASWWKAWGLEKSLSKRAPFFILYEYLLTVRKIRNVISVKIDKKLNSIDCKSIN